MRQGIFDDWRVDQIIFHLTNSPDGRCRIQQHSFASSTDPSICVQVSCLSPHVSCSVQRVTCTTARSHETECTPRGFRFCRRIVPHLQSKFLSLRASTATIPTPNEQLVCFPLFCDALSKYRGTRESGLSLTSFRSCCRLSGRIFALYCDVMI